MFPSIKLYEKPFALFLDKIVFLTPTEIPFWKTFFSKNEVYKHWYCPLDNFEYSSHGFYQAIEKELQARKVPGLEMSGVDLSEGGLLSNKRKYLR